jgi:small subunit ribosomal protein S20
VPNLKKNPSALKAVRRDARKAVYRGAVRSSTRTQIKRARGLIAGNKVEGADEAVLNALRALDNAAEKGVIHKNAAARRKSRLMKALNKAKAAQAAQPAGVPQVAKR